jgi:DNA ligase-1
MDAAILLAEVWDQETDPAGYWMSEKLDGVRALWDGEKFVSRNGNVFAAPAWFVASMPSGVALDGELWIGRGRFQETVGIVRRKNADDAWRQIRYLVFDAPDRDEPFEARMAFLRQLLPSGTEARIGVVEQVQCKGTSHLYAELHRIEELGGEGLMLRQPASRYERKRSRTLLKVKSFLDAEATVIDHQPGRGKLRGLMGALLVTMPSGVEFAVGTGFTDAQRQNPPPVGSVITYRYQELSSRGVPRFPSFMRSRH